MSSRIALPFPSLRRSVLLTALAAVASIALLGLGVPAASAHDALTGAAPADGAAVATPPDRVELQFSGVVQELGAQVVVRGPDGTTVSQGDPEVVDTTLEQPLGSRLPAGTYTVEWRVTSADGHPISGTTSFTATTGTGAGPAADGASAASSTRPAAASSSSGPGIAIAAGIALVLAVTVGARSLRRRA
ncbi:copper resistance CopC family protein [Blastococcus sp. URHD0036]|uniref:copper resistance CopC family protein n=1 Tax=Blastococcus sp. URHD0036 TaxID=1380356 RepID=UPI0006906565|nr:copper resistance CopC family protein [Blastococcus sp. URHD0036]